MSNLANTIYQAIVAHTIWKKRLRDSLETGDADYESCAENCEFGKWLRQDAEVLRVYSHYAPVFELHEEFHKSAHEVIGLVRNGKIEVARNLLQSGGAFEQTSRKLTEEIIAWHDVVMGKK
ncbi:MAG: CZB domain-containing protein [Thiotrichaceae bacterium]|nr:CZB domain-containing protein [Thiotrichaceae bacterium]